MIGVYDYTVILTYISLISGITGTIFAMTGIGHPFCGAFFLMVSGLCDAFDGRVARSKKNRTDFEKNYGVQIDSLCDMVCFGVLPVAIGFALLRVYGIFTEISKRGQGDELDFKKLILILIAVIYCLAALVRLAYFNATEEERKAEAKVKKAEYYTGLPVTSAALVYPLILIADWFISADFTFTYFILMLVMAILFVGKFKIKKLSNKVLGIMIVIGFIEFITMLFILI